MENVPGIATEFNKPILDEFIGRLENKNGIDSEKYFVRKKVLNAADYGVPQIRKRFVLHGVRMDIYRELQTCGMDFDLPAPTHNIHGFNNLLPCEPDDPETYFVPSELGHIMKYDKEIRCFRLTSRTTLKELHYIFEKDTIPENEYVMQAGLGCCPYCYGL